MIEISSMDELLAICQEQQKSISEIMLSIEAENTGQDMAAIIEEMKKRLLTMKQAVDNGLANDVIAPSGISGDDTGKIAQYMAQGEALSGNIIGDAMTFSAAVSESNARMDVIVATPTAGAAGILPGVLCSLHKNKQLSLDELTMGLFTASMLGLIIANRSFISGSAGGCQAEVGSATAMAAGTIVELNRGTPEQAINATALALKSLLGLVCDPVAGLVEVPCIKRNVIGTSIAFSAADLSLAGVKSRIPCDEVIEAMYNIGKEMPRTLKETSLGGLAATATAQKVEDTLFKRWCNT
ncbi:L-serine ammonia-lyase, iron-sulfur-dependent, subunit alpha [Gracilibacillus sp. S3-1-1]|uniref:L-serine ammonia-lyase, iron-sulfur-dependent, subunit alpha n=1 Tax=Gracilibacillus pellucidus TaxID=3095368 RepID=A0ACC6M036_9BACI|nr:L-serine ammonia-lyase, iron-sulfur-dependent, subunit alpha [Gracilibacillus sp. S3-1-1]MDX8044359.1 L-serine ammonia-lyase, iron-sulfur-dependent, subunit alpha [Gracilibacillus sp. S3-1-1]